MASDMEPIYASRPTFFSLGQVYRLYPDRLELPFFGCKIVVPLADIITLDVRPACVVCDLFRGNGRAALALKLDLADLAPHVALHRRSGTFKFLRFTPDDPAGFVEAWQRAIS
ncbi:MAG: hypothetical protein BWY76_00298 [bacterium ADurb.Bin429]|nr:MAG: hypothetical protein BWY76_00298 [bacterium ADurb.Bin429]